MTKANSENRRRFLQGSATAAGLVGGVLASGHASKTLAADTKLNGGASKANRLPREVAIATISQDGLRASNSKKMIELMLGRMSEAARVEPDIICLPEVFPFANLEGGRESVAEVAETGIGKTLTPLSEFAADHSCYLVCPIYTRSGDQCFNSAVFLDRQGNIMGEYRKIHPTVTEMANGVMPGPLEAPTFEADFGRLGAQICFDIEWDDGWRSLQKQGAEIIFWPSAFAGGQTVNARAWQHRCCVVSSTRKDASKICDFGGEQLATSSRWQQWAWATVNLEKVFLHTWPYVNRFGDMLSKYGHRIRITTHALEEWSIIESRDPGLDIVTLMQEFELLSIDDHLGQAEVRQHQLRRS